MIMGDLPYQFVIEYNSCHHLWNDYIRFLNDVSGNTVAGYGYNYYGLKGNTLKMSDSPEGFRVITLDDWDKLRYKSSKKYELPEKWAIKVTSENWKKLNEWRGGGLVCGGGYLHYPPPPDSTRYNSYFSYDVYKSYSLISDDIFDEHVIKLPTSNKYSLEYIASHDVAIRVRNFEEVQKVDAIIHQNHSYLNSGVSPDECINANSTAHCGEEWYQGEGFTILEAREFLDYHNPGHSQTVSSTGCPIGGGVSITTVFGTTPKKDETKLIML